MDLGEIKLLAVAVMSDDRILTVEGIAFAGKLWLVSKWLEVLVEGASTPVRMIRFDNQSHEKFPETSMWDYALNVPVSKAVFDGQTDGGFEILKGRQITCRIRRPRKML